VKKMCLDNICERRKNNKWKRKENRKYPYKKGRPLITRKQDEREQTQI
jgi:hypothetical protein